MNATCGQLVESRFLCCDLPIFREWKQIDYEPNEDCGLTLIEAPCSPAEAGSPLRSDKLQGIFDCKESAYFMKFAR